MDLLDPLHAGRRGIPSDSHLIEIFARRRSAGVGRFRMNNWKLRMDDAMLFSDHNLKNFAIVNCQLSIVNNLEVSMSVSQVYKSDTRMMARIKALLERVDITLDEHLDYTCAVFDEEGQPIATGSAFGSTLRCFAVDPAHQGEGLLNEVITHLMEDRLNRGYFHLFVYTKPGSAKFFKDLGFSQIAEVPGILVFLENRKNGFSAFLKKLESFRQPGQSAAIVMNANPFTRGHRYLIELAARENDAVHLFILSENAGPIPAKIRQRLVREGVADLPNVICHETGEYLISSATFPGYFLKSEEKILRKLC